MRAILLFILMLPAVVLSACSCGTIKSASQFAERNYAWHDKIFVGVVIKQSDDSFDYAMEVIHSFKGVSKGDTLRGRYNNSCARIPQEEGLWLVYATDENLLTNEINISMCSNSRNLDSKVNNKFDSLLTQADAHKVITQSNRNLLEMIRLSDLKNHYTKNTFSSNKSKSYLSTLLSTIAIMLSLGVIFLNIRMRKA